MGVRSSFEALSSVFCGLFAVWIAMVSAAALVRPQLFGWLKPSAFPALMGLLMFSVGMTTTPSDFRACLSRPRPVVVNFLACYALMPALAVLLAGAAQLPNELAAGIVLIATVNGGQASNLCALIAGADVPLSVLMTVTTTAGGIVLTPLLVKVVLGAVIPVNVWGVLFSAVQVVLVPVCLGVAANLVAPTFCKAVTPFIPSVGILVSVAVVGASVASCATPILEASAGLHIALVAMHVLGAALGYGLAAVLGCDPRVCQTVAIEVAMKSSAFAFVLAVLHFQNFTVRVPAATDCIWCPLTASVLAVFWRRTWKARKGATSVDTAGADDWVANYNCATAA